MLIDEVKIHIKAGNGGDGNVHFYRDRHQPKGGPDGGDGGNGGDVFFIAGSDITLLRQFRHRKKFLATDGQKGGTNKRTGKGGQDLILKVPVGTVVNYDNGTSLELTVPDQQALIAKGGKGGKGNFYFRSSTNTTPLQSQPGQETTDKKLFLQLKLIAQAGLIGLPNAGKTSLLNQLTSADAKVASYAFTTLEPNLGVTKGKHILADIPGLIEGAASGKGLGYKFLRHIERTNLLIHCISSESLDPKEDYQTIRHELEKYSSFLAKKPELIIITKKDLAISPSQLKKDFSSLKPHLYTSIDDPASIKALNDLLSQKLST